MLSIYLIFISKDIIFLFIRITFALIYIDHNFNYIYRKQSLIFTLYISLLFNILIIVIIEGWFQCIYYPLNYT